MAAFTQVTNGFAPQLNMAEIVNAVNERRLAAIASGATGLPGAIPTASPQSFQGGAVKPTHLLIQEMLEALATRYVDHGVDYDDASAFTPMTTFTVGTWRTSAGLNASGFRRATAWANPAAAPSFSYGNIQTGDIAGYWIWEDIVKGLKALRWTVRTPTRVDTQEKVVTKTGYPWASVRADADSDWPAAAWVANEFVNAWRATRVQAGVHSYNPETEEISSYGVGIRAEKAKAFCNFGFSVPIAFSAVFIFRAFLDGDAYYDFESTPQNEWVEKETVNVAAGASSVTSQDYLLTSTPATPLSDSGIPEPTISVSYWYGSVSPVRVVLKWTFSHS